ncbi:hypothetical protein J14TS2_00600 [Bacillus sp. J14TS2]|uniref:DUF5054 domain-containing protein n=1 Tax=Bacillus sp. J14TS2 TaxID=2807188 RepID=UPI001B0E24B9|nr:DUF5054 domain-containing protein [Bacillus sp. J14TS2]GIN69585.1 hypothetical protein J14TS2_00600 [Bacillus sp. J14TS2]
MRSIKTNIEVVHVIFKTHLDIGFTDLAETVTNEYIHSYIPKAIKLANNLKQAGGNAEFIWTTGSWLIDEYLKRTGGEQQQLLEEAINQGFITWHGLPFTTHTELMDRNLFNYGLSIAKKLDKQFSKETISAKMTDVPGHTKAIIPLMAEQGIKYLHLGVNPASKVPDVPNIFLWKGTNNSEIIVNYADNYGDILQVEGLNEVMVFAHTGDNLGPPSEKDIEGIFDKLQSSFPNAKIKASTMDCFANRILKFKHKLPVVYEEIGDSWIHGVGTDPKKVSKYRELLRLRNKWLEQGDFDLESKEYTDFSDSLLMIPEHTWGLDEKKFLSDYKNYTKEEFSKARALDHVQKDAIPDKYSYIGLFAMDEANISPKTAGAAWFNRSYQFFEKSWKEQREFIDKAIAALSFDKQKQVQDAFLSLKPVKQMTGPFESLTFNQLHSLTHFTVSFADDGSINQLIDKNGKEWVNVDNSIGAFRYESFGVDNYNRWFEQYVENIKDTHHWSDADQGKPGMELINPIPKYREDKGKLVALKKKETPSKEIIQVELSMADDAVELLGAPKEVVILYEFSKEKPKIDIELSWFHKQANRLPEAIWLSFTINVANENIWEMEKVGERISPLHVVQNGNRNLHAIGSGVYYKGSDGSVELKTKDAPLISIGEKRLLQFDNTFASMNGGFHFNLYNNIWGTNFPMWYEEDAKFRFSLDLTSYK